MSVAHLGPSRPTLTTHFIVVQHIHQPNPVRFRVDDQPGTLPHFSRRLNLICWRVGWHGGMIIYHKCNYKKFLEVWFVEVGEVTRYFEWQRRHGYSVRNLPLVADCTCTEISWPCLIHLLEWPYYRCIQVLYRNFVVQAECMVSEEMQLVPRSHYHSWAPANGSGAYLN